MSSNACLMLCTCPNLAEAESLAAHLVNARLAACVNLIPSISSIYRWDNAVERASEVLLLIKTSVHRRDETKQSILELHSYAIPEILIFHADWGAEAYLGWLEASTRDVEKKS